jgi:iron(III) transport system substrate-binding protein
MLSRRTFTLAGLALTTTGCSVGPDGFGSRLGFAAGNSRLAADAAKEGSLRIDAATGLTGVGDLMDSFTRRYPGIKIDFRRASSQEQHAIFLQEAASGGATADILISPAMDLQFKLINDGFAQAYASPEKPHLPDWAVWNDEAYAITADPLVFAYNQALVPAADVPHSHDELTDLLRRKPDVYRGKVASYDPELSATGYLYYTQDLLLSRDTLDLVQAVARTQPKFYVTGTDVRDKLTSGEHLLAYNMVNSYMISRRAQHPNVRIVFPSDYTLVVLRIAFIPKQARHPASGKLFLDFLLSELGQALMAREFIQPVRNGIPMSGAVPPPEVLRRIHFGPSLLANLDDVRRRGVLREWRRVQQA